jgi:anhydro-N-acetylmuramic acid kinase
VDQDKRIFAGIRLGRSGRGLGAALVETTGRAGEIRPQILASRHRRFPPELTEQWSQAIWAEALAHDVPVVRLVAEIRQAVERLTREAGIEPSSLQAVGLLVPQTPGRDAPIAADLSRRSGWRVIGGMARSDRAAGGLGEPLWAWPIWKLLVDPRLSRLVVGLGSLTKLAQVGSGSQADEVVAGVIGPGTCLLDHFAGELFGRDCDEDGALAAAGIADPALVNELLGHHAYDQTLPYRVRCADLSGTYRQRVGKIARDRGIDGKDLLATLTDVTAGLIARLAGKLTERPHQVVLAGGGAVNIALASRIRQLMSPSSTITAEALGLPGRCLGAVAAAILAAMRCDGQAIWTPSATGAICPAVLGTVFQAAPGQGEG